MLINSQQTGFPTLLFRGSSGMEIDQSRGGDLFMRSQHYALRCTQLHKGLRKHVCQYATVDLPPLPWSCCCLHVADSSASISWHSLRDTRASTLRRAKGLHASCASSLPFPARHFHDDAGWSDMYSYARHSKLIVSSFQLRPTL